MKKIRCSVAMSLDGYIAGPNGEADWIAIDPELDFDALWAEFDIGLMGRRTYEAAMARLGKAAFERMKIIVVSRTLRPADHPEIEVRPELTRDWLQALRAQKGKDIWLSSAVVSSFVICSRCTWSIPLRSQLCRCCWETA